MATFTVQLYEIIEAGYKLPLDTYPIHDENYRDRLNNLIIDHYKFQEIGQETVDQFLFALKRKMNEIMPYYCDLYRTIELDYDILTTVDYTQTGTEGSKGKTVGVSEGKGRSDSTTDNKARVVNSDTPQSQLSEYGDYASSGSDTISQTGVNSENVSESTEESNSENQTNSETRYKGYQAPPAELIELYRQTLINVDMMVINDLQELFMLLWDNGDHYTHSGGLGHAGIYGLGIW